MSIVMHVLILLVLQHKFYEYKQIVEYTPYKRALIENREQFSKSIDSYRAAVV